MTPGTKKWLLIGGSLLVIGGVVYYFAVQSKKSNDKLNGGTEEDETTDENQGGGTTPTPTPTPNDKPVNQLPAELSSSDKVKKFQDFMDKVGPWVKGVDGKFKKLNKGAGYGIAGPSTLGAFAGYQNLYRVYLRADNKANVVPVIGTSPAAIDINLSNGTIARYQRDNKFVHFASAYGSVNNTGTWANGGRKIVITFGPKKGTIDTNNMWDSLKSLIS